MSTARANTQNLAPFWMPFTANRQFKAEPRLFVAAKDMHYTDFNGRAVLDASAGLWCVNAGHCRQPIVEAVQRQVATLDYSPAFSTGHPKAFELAERLSDLAPRDFAHVFFTNSGSESVDTALKIAIAYHNALGKGSRQRLIGRERGYHGVGFGGITVGGIANNRRSFGCLLPGVDHLPHTHDIKRNAFSRGQPEHGADLADALENIVTLHGPTTIAAVIVEPMAGATGVLVPPRGYLERLREICDQHGILLIFDEVITGFGRLGASFAAERFGVMPDIIAVAKGLTNGTVPMGAVLIRETIYEAFMQAPSDSVELFHGYTYSGHPLACAAALATLDLYARERLFERARDLSSYWEDAVHSLRHHPHVIDIRSIGLVAGIELEAVNGKAGTRGFDVFKRCYDKGVFVRPLGDTIALSPPLIIEKFQIDQVVETLGHVLDETRL